MASRRRFLRQSAALGAVGILPGAVWRDFPTLARIGDRESLTLSAHTCAFAYESDFFRRLRSKYPGYDNVLEIASRDQDVKGYLAYSVEWKTAILAFRGTVFEPSLQGILNVIADLNTDLVAYWGPGKGQYYAGFWSAYAPVRDQVNAAVREAHGRMGGCDNFVVTGHSLGASLAMLAKMDVGNTLNGSLRANANVETNLIAFPNSASQEFINWQSSGVIRYVYIEGDPVTANSTFPSDRNLWWPYQAVPLGWNAHAMTSYIDRIEGDKVASGWNSNPYNGPHRGGVW